MTRILDEWLEYLKVKQNGKKCFNHSKLDDQWKFHQTLIQIEKIRTTIIPRSIKHD